MTDIQKYLSGDIKNMIDYRRFNQDNKLDDNQVLWNIRDFIATEVNDILLININEDKMFLTKKELEKIPLWIRHYLKKSEYRGIKMYVFNTKDGWFKSAVGVFGWSIVRTNEYFFDKIIADEKYKNITSTIQIKLTELLNT